MKTVTRSKWLVLFALFMAVFGFGTFQTETEASAETTRYEDNTYDVYTSGDFEYIVITESTYDKSALVKSAVIVHYNGTAASVAIPTTLAGLPVAEIGYKNPHGWSDTYDGAFEENSALQTVTIPSSVKVVQAQAFRNCSGLQQVLFAEGIQYIAPSAFRECGALQRVQFQGNSLEVISKQAFAYDGALDNVAIPDSVQTIGEMAYGHCTSLSSIVIPDSVTTLGGGAFYACTSLETAVIGNGVTELTYCDDWSLRGDYEENYKGYYQGAFENCASLTSVTIGSAVQSVGIDTFANTSLEELIIPDNVTVVDSGAFYNCDRLSALNFGNGVKKINHKVCYSCGKLNTVTFGKKVQSIGDLAFAFNTSLQELTIPGNVSTIGGGAFYACTSMTKAVIGNGVTSLTYLDNWAERGDYEENYKGYYQGAFENCTSLAEIELGDGLTSIGADTFANTALVKVTIPGRVTEIGNGAFINCKQLTAIDISDSVITIGDSCFRRDTALQQINIGKGVTTIGELAFANCTALPSLLLPSNVTSLGAGVCYADMLLSKVIVGNGVTNLTYLDNWAERGDYAENYKGYYQGAFENCKALADVALGSGLTSIGADTFAGTAITSLLIPAKVNMVGDGAFYDAALKTLYFTGAAPAFGKNLFGSSSTPETFKLAGKSGYDATDYAFTDFKPVTVTYSLNNSDVFAIAPSDQYLAPEGGYVIEPIDPAALGYRFLGWYADSACTKAWDFLNTPVSEDTTLYAKWAAVNEIAPEAPTNLTEVTATSSAITISWDAMEGAEGYQVYVDGELVTASAVKETAYTASNLEADTAYEITVVATNAAGASEQSLAKVVWTAEAADVLLGDVDENGEVSAADALMTLKFVVKLSTPTAAQTQAADVSMNGQIEAEDALLILKYVVRLIDSF